MQTTSSHFLNDFIEYWNSVLQQWFKKTIEKKQQEYKIIYKKSTPLVAGVPEPMYNYMPEPYMGEPRNCSFVIVNYNCGGGDDRDPHIYRHCVHCKNSIPLSSTYVCTNGYSKYALPFPFLQDASWLKKHGLNYLNTYSGYKWWQSRKPWIDHIHDIIYNSKQDKESKLPFAIDLCPWHEKSWSNVKDLTKNPDIKKVVEDYVMNVIIEAIRNSDGKFAFFIGKRHVDLLKSFGFTPTTQKPRTEISAHKTRYYQVFTKQPDVKAIVTWIQGSNSVPSADFYAADKKYIQNI